jgi:hypothetical protein
VARAPASTKAARRARESVEKAVVARGVHPGEVRQLSYVGTPGRSIEVCQAVGPEGWKNTLAETVGGKLRMVPQVRGCGVRSGDDFDVEAVEQCARTERGIGHASGDPVIDGVGRLGARDQIDPEYLDELVFQPVARRRTAEEFPVLAEPAPDLSRVCLNWTPIEPRHPDLSRLDALGGQHPEDVVIGNDQQLRRVGELYVIGERLRFHVAVHADKRQVFGCAVDFPGEAPLFCWKRESTVRVEVERRHWATPSDN